MSHIHDVAVVGLGFGGLGSTLEFARQGADVVAFENLVYPGGCASTFKRRGFKFESGATLFSGFGDGQLFRRWMDEYDMPVVFEPLEPIIEFRTPEFTFQVSRDRDEFIERWCAMPGAPTEGIREFYALQKRIADTLWELFDEPELLPPFKASSLLSHIRRSPKYLPLLPWIGQPLQAALNRFGLTEFEPLRAFLDAVCQITIQCSAAEAETPFALGAMDYFFRGTGHVKGGIGHLAWAISNTIEDLGGDVRYGDGVRALIYDDGSWLIRTRKGDTRARSVVSNLLPSTTQQLVSGIPMRDHGLQKRVEDGWGACMLYLAVPADICDRADAHHWQLIADSDKPFLSGNHVFVSISGTNEDRGPDGMRTVTVSTHVPMAPYVNGTPESQASYIDATQTTMKDTLNQYLPGWLERAELVMTGSPRTFERFTRRGNGYVGGVPRVAGLHHYLSLVPRPHAPDLYLVGDSVFPGQSTLATAIGGTRVATSVMRRMQIPDRRSSEINANSFAQKFNIT